MKMTAHRLIVTLSPALILTVAPSWGFAQTTTQQTTTTVTTHVNTDTTTSQNKDIVAMAAASGNYSTLAKLLVAANLASTLQGSAQFTMFAPTDEAFAKLPPGALDALQADTTQLKKVLLYHVVSGVITADKIFKLKNARTLEGAKIDFSTKDTRLHVGKAVIVQPDIKASNGVIHGIDAVLMPPK